MGSGLEFGDFLGVALVCLDLLVGFALGLGRRHDDAVDLELTETTGENKSGGTGFVAHVEILEFDTEFLGEGSKGSFDREI